MGLSVNTQTPSGGVCNISVGQVTTDGAAAADTVFNCGFLPRYIKWMNKATMLSLEWYEGMVPGTALRTVAAGTRTTDVAPAGIGVGTVAANTAGQFTIKAADIPASGNFVWMAIG